MYFIAKSGDYLILSESMQSICSPIFPECRNYNQNSKYIIRLNLTNTGFTSSFDYLKFSFSFSSDLYWINNIYWTADFAIYKDLELKIDINKNLINVYSTVLPFLFGKEQVIQISIIITKNANKVNKFSYAYEMQYLSVEIENSFKHSSNPLSGRKNH